MELALTIDSSSTAPVYKSLALAIRESIQAGRLSPGQKLPSASELAELVGTSRSTIVKAYQTLIAEGYLETLVGSGTYVKSTLRIENVSNYGNAIKCLDVELSKLASQLMEKKSSLASAGDLPALNFGAPPPGLLPVRTWQDILLQYCKAEDRKIEYTSDACGYLPLRTAIASFLGRSKGVKCSADQVIIFSGAQQALNCITMALVNQGDSVIVENPGYCGARDTFESHGARVHAIDVNENGLRVDKLTEIGEPIKLVHITLPHHDPTGATMPDDRRQALLTWAANTKTLILEDAWDSEYNYCGPAQPALQSQDEDGRVLYIYSFWKLLYPLVATSVLVVPRHLVPIFQKIKLSFDRQFPTIEEYVLSEFINHGHLERHIQRTRSTYRRLRQELIFELTNAFASNISFPNFSAGLHQLVRFGKAFESRETMLLTAAKDAGLPMVSTIDYYIKSPIRGEFIVSFSTLSSQEIKTSVKSFAKGLRPSATEQT